jgi:hypothetical protein
MEGSRIKTYWRLGALTCELFTGDGKFELRLQHGNAPLKSEVCADGAEAYQKSKEWHRAALRRSPDFFP